MHSQGIKVVPFLSNGWDTKLGESALNIMGPLTDSIKTAVEKYGFDGVNIDLEHLDERHRDQYTLFVKTLAREIGPRQRSVGCSRLQIRGAATTGWQGSYDYEELSKYASHLLIMAYDREF